MSALQSAMAAADRGLDWSRPCLIWVADYLAEATGIDPAAAWREVAWDEGSARRHLAMLALGGVGSTAVERAIDGMAKRLGWVEADGPRQGAVMIGVFTSADGVGVPAIFDGGKRWVFSNTGRGWTSTAEMPVRMWEVGGAIGA